MARGGKRDGSGRKLSALTTKSRAIAERATAEGISPLEVMLANMRHFQQVALDAEAVLEGLTAEDFLGREVEPAEQFKALLAEVKKAAGLRQAAQECARDAAPYVHPRLTAVALSGEVTAKFVAELPAVAKTVSEWQSQHIPLQSRQQ